MSRPPSREHDRDECPGGGRPFEVLRPTGRGQPRPHGKSRRSLRFAGTERRGQDDDAAYDRRPPQTRRGSYRRVRRRRPGRPSGGETDDRLGAGRADALRPPDADGISRVRRRALGRRAEGRASLRRDPAEVARPVGRSRQALRGFFARHEAEDGPGRRADPRSQAADPGRTADRPRRQRPRARSRMC